jgi:hypothetical protein
VSGAQKVFQHVEVAIHLSVECCLCEATNSIEHIGDSPPATTRAMDYSIFLTRAGWTTNGEGVVCPRCSKR